MKVILSMHHAYNITGYYEYVPETNDPQLKILYGQQGKEENEATGLDIDSEPGARLNAQIMYPFFRPQADSVG